MTGDIETGNPLDGFDVRILNALQSGDQLTQHVTAQIGVGVGGGRSAIAAKHTIYAQGTASFV
jgi:hypothetical protein